MDFSVLRTGALMALSLIIFFLFLFFNFTHNIKNKTLLELLLTAELIYIFGYTCELASEVVSQKIFFNHFEYIGLVMIAPIWYLISVQFAEIESKWLKLKYLLFVIPAIALIGNFTFASNQYFYKSFIPSNDNSGLFIILYEKGFLYYIHNIFQLIIAALSALNYYNVYKKASGTKRKQSAILMGLSVFGFLIVASSHFSRYTSNFNRAAFLIGVSSFVLLLTLFQYELFELLPLVYVKVFESIDTPILILDDAKSIVRCNTAAVNIFGSNLIKSKKVTEAFKDEPELLNALSNNKSCVIDRIVDGRQMYFSTKLIKLDKKSKEISSEYGYILTFTNETEHINKVRMLENAAYIDPLTEVYNRRYFFEKANQAVEEAKNSAAVFSLIMIDVDKFKSINDNFGHLLGDFVLKTISGVMQEQLTCKDVIARYGGEEFIILLPGSDFENAMTAAEKISRGVRENKFKYGEGTIAVTVSIGVFTPEFPLPASASLEKYIAVADNCLYHAKKNGGDRVFGINGAFND